jgi:hypothetical protein
MPRWWRLDTIWEKEKKIYFGRAQGGHLPRVRPPLRRLAAGTPKPSNLEALRKNAAKMAAATRKSRMSLTASRCRTARR